jgi:hypothetical protein
MAKTYPTAWYRRLKHRCTAHSKTTKMRCRRPAIPGGTVCYYHGGAAPQVQASAKERLAALVDPAIDRMVKLIKSKRDPVALGAVKDVLDRAGLKGPDQDKVSIDEILGLVARLLTAIRAEIVAAIDDPERARVLILTIHRHVTEALPLPPGSVIDGEMSHAKSESEPTA